MPLVAVAFDDFVPAGPTDLNLHVPNLNIAGWEYGGAGNGWVVASAPSGRALRETGDQFVRSTADIGPAVLDTSGPFTVIMDMARGAVDTPGAFGHVGVFLRGSGTGTPYNGEGVWVGMERVDASTATIRLRRRDATSVVEALTFASITYPAGKRLTFNFSGDGVTVEAIEGDLFTGLSPTNLGTQVLTTDIRDSDHQRIGMNQNPGPGSGQMANFLFEIQQDAALLNPWSECDPCSGATVWAASDACND